MTLHGRVYRVLRLLHLLLMHLLLLPLLLRLLLLHLVQLLLQPLHILHILHLLHLHLHLLLTDLGGRRRGGALQSKNLSRHLRGRAMHLRRYPSPNLFNFPTSTVRRAQPETTNNASDSRKCRGHRTFLRGGFSIGCEGFLC